MKSLEMSKSLKKVTKAIQTTPSEAEEEIPEVEAEALLIEEIISEITKEMISAIIEIIEMNSEKEDSEKVLINSKMMIITSEEIEEEILFRFVSIN